MSRYLFVVPPLVGHVNPAAGVAAELERRGHDVAWVAHESLVGELLGPGPAVYPAGDGFLAELAEAAGERERLKGPAALKFLWERFLVPLAVHMAGPVRAAVDDFRPDVVVADQQAFAGGIVATERGLVWVSSVTTSADLGDPAPLLPKIGEWMEHQVAELCRRLGASELAEDGFDPRYSPHLMLAYSLPALASPGDTALSQRDAVAFVGPVLGERPAVSFPMEWLDGFDEHVLVSFGTASGDIAEPFLQRVVEAVDGQRYGVVLVGSPSLVPAVPANVLIRPFVPQLDLLERMDAVVCHGGHNTTVEALAAGVPLVCAPIRDDQPVVAGQVVRAGAGVRVSFGRARPAAIAQAIDQVLTEAAYRSTAVAIGASFASVDGAFTAADHLERIGRRSAITSPNAPCSQ